VNREPTLDDLIGDETPGAERQRLQRVHELLLEAGPPPELSPELEAGPKLGTTLGRQRRRKPRALLLLAAAMTVFIVFLAGYGAGSHGSGKSGDPVLTQALKGTSIAPQAEGALQVWSSKDGNNWPMTLSVVDLPSLPPHIYYEVYLVRNGKPWGSCGSFRIGSSGSARGVTVTLTAPYPLQQGDSWVVTRRGVRGAEPGPTVLRPVQA
jgi:hypothetical protein